MSAAASYRPEAFHDITPYLVVGKGQANGFIDFLKTAFDAQERLVLRDPDGRLAHGEFTIGDCVIELGESAGDWTSRAGLHFFVTNVDDVHKKALAAGAKELTPPVDHEYGERSSGIEDPVGNHWYIAMALPGRV